MSYLKTSQAGSFGIGRFPTYPFHIQGIDPTAGNLGNAISVTQAREAASGDSVMVSSVENPVTGSALALLATLSATQDAEIRLRNNNTVSATAHATVRVGSNGGDPKVAMERVSSGRIFSFGIDVSDGERIKLSEDLALETNTLFQANPVGDIDWFAPAGGSYTIQLGDAAGGTNLSIRDSTATEVFSVDSSGGVTMSATGTNSVSWTVNQDAAGGTDEDPRIDMLGGDGASLKSSSILFETTSERWSIFNDDAGVDATVDLTIGAIGVTDDIDAILRFSAGTGAGNREAVASYDGATDRLAWSGNLGTVRFPDGMDFDYTQAADDAAAGGVTFTAGKGGNAVAGVGQAGADLTFTAGDGGDGTGVLAAGNGANIILEAGAAGVDGGGGPGVKGNVVIGGTNAVAINIGNAVDNNTVSLLGTGQKTIAGNLDVTGGLDVTGADLTTGDGIEVQIGSAANTAIGRLQIFDSGAAGGAGEIVLYDQAGNPSVLWVDATGDFRIEAGVALKSGDLAGVVVGTQL